MLNVCVKKKKKKRETVTRSGKTQKDRGAVFEICEMFLLCERTVHRAAMLPATEPHRDVKRRAIFLQCQESL